MEEQFYLWKNKSDGKSQRCECVLVDQGGEARKHWLVAARSIFNLDLNLNKLYIPTVNIQIRF